MGLAGRFGDGDSTSYAGWFGHCFPATASLPLAQLRPGSNQPVIPAPAAASHAPVCCAAAASAACRPEQGAAVLHRFGHVGAADAGRCGQIGDAARQAQGAVDAAGRPAQLGGSALQQLQGGGVGVAVFVQSLALQLLVEHALARQGQGTGGGHALADAGTGLARRGLQQGIGRQRCYFYLHIHAIKQRAADTALVARHLLG